MASLGRNTPLVKPVNRITIEVLTWKNLFGNEQRGENDMVVHDARAQMLGYLYQVRYALCYLLHATDSSAQMSIEKFDDICLESETGTPLELIQTKYHTKREGDLSDRSSDLWRTLKVWIDAVSANETLLEHTYFIIITTAAIPSGSAAAYIYKKQPEAAFEALKAVAEKGGNKAHAKFYDSFLKFDESALIDLLSRVKIFSGALNIEDTLENIKRSIRISCRPEHLNYITERVEGWWIQEVIKALLSDNSVIVSQRQLLDKVYVVSREYDDDNLPIECWDLDPLEEEELDPRERIFLEQLRLLQSSNRTLNLAIKDYYRASTQRSSWLRQGLVYANDLDSYEYKLKDAWEHAFAAMKEDLADYGTPSDKEKIIAGRNMYRKVSDLDIRIRDKCDAPFVMRGTYHILANELKVGWHVDFARKLEHLLEGM